MSWRRLLALIAGPVVFVLLAHLAPATLPDAAARVLGVAGWMAVWWLAEPVPLGATSLLPLALFPVLGVTSAADAAAPYANELVFLFLAGFLLAAALRCWNAHSRIAYALIAFIGTGERRVVLGVMVATAFISMWISNTATAAMMYPIVIAIAELASDGEGSANLRTSLILGMAFAASIGGIATLIGTPPNLIFAGAAEQLLGRPVGFVPFLLIGLPIALILLPVAWFLLVFVLFPSRVSFGSEAAREMAERRRALGPLRGGERTTVIVFALTALAWLVREPKRFGTFTMPGIASFAPHVTDASIGILSAVVLFVLAGRSQDGTRRPLLSWAEAREIPWEVLLLFGGGLSLAAAMESSGLATWLGAAMAGLRAYPVWVVYLGLAALVVLLSELASNTATASMIMPIAVSLAHAIGRPPLTLMLIAALAASGGFALPVATPPNTIAFASGHVSARQMARAGLLLDVVTIGLVVVAAMTIAHVVL
ncbi:MAG TPA: DASS family sodium-coupled anion symporter [Gemmatimonadaceae bacterium]|nr:DASS family sodium-coupled anion symporter [Gemmatimonadaceae bacterium]